MKFSCGIRTEPCPTCGGDFYCDDPDDYDQPPQVRDTGDALGQVLKDALDKAKSR